MCNVQCTVYSVSWICVNSRQLSVENFMEQTKTLRIMLLLIWNWNWKAEKIVDCGFWMEGLKNILLKLNLNREHWKNTITWHSLSCLIISIIIYWMTYGQGRCSMFVPSNFSILYLMRTRMYLVFTCII